MLDKQTLTQQLIQQLPQDDRPGFSEALKYWWQDSRPDSGMRLSVQGFELLKVLNVARHEFEFTHTISPSVLMTLNKKLDCPYFIKAGKTSQLIIFGSEQAVMYAMYGDLEKFLRYLNRT